jgi:hypothetical protein
VAEGYDVTLGSHILGLLKVFQAYFELVATSGSGGTIGVEALQFSQPSLG